MLTKVCSWRQHGGQGWQLGKSTKICTDELMAGGNDSRWLDVKVQKFVLEVEICARYCTARVGESTKICTGSGFDHVLFLQGFRLGVIQVINQVIKQVIRLVIRLAPTWWAGLAVCVKS